MSRVSHRHLNSTGISRQRSKGQPPAVLAGLRCAQNIQSHLKTIRLTRVHGRAVQDFLTLDGGRVRSFRGFFRICKKKKRSNIWLSATSSGHFLQFNNQCLYINDSLSPSAVPQIISAVSGMKLESGFAYRGSEPQPDIGRASQTHIHDSTEIFLPRVLQPLPAE